MTDVTGKLARLALPGLPRPFGGWGGLVRPRPSALYLLRSDASFLPLLASELLPRVFTWERVAAAVSPSSFLFLDLSPLALVSHFAKYRTPLR